jgi:glycosyltransferase involved in cell wall biosynthesis
MWIKKASIAEAAATYLRIMRILLDCRPLQLAGPAAEKCRLIFSAAAGLSREGVEWVIMADHRYRPGLFPELPGRVVIRRSLSGAAGWRLWYSRQVRRLLRQEGVDMVWLTGGIGVTGLEVPICLWMPERADPSEGGGVWGYESLYRRRLKEGLASASAVFCYSDRDRVWLGRILPAARERIHVVAVMPDEKIGPLSVEEKEDIRAVKTAGKEYFFADLTGCVEEVVVDLLKAFSLFKKRQQSGIRLVLAGRPGAIGAGKERAPAAGQRVSELLKTYKYRQDVDWAVAVAEHESLSLAGAAYAVLLPVEGNSLGTTLLNTWRVGVPVIAAGGGLLEEMAQGAVLGIVQGDPASLAGQLMRIYKEEDLRKELIGKGFERLKVYSRENFQQVLRVITEIAAC